MEEENKKKQIAVPTVEEPTQGSTKSILEMDIDLLKTEMMAGMYNTESSLYKQAGFQNVRLDKIRVGMTHLEEEIFDPKFIDELTDESKISLYELASKNVKDILDFMMSLHKTIEGGVNVLNQIETLKNDKENKILSKEQTQDEGQVLKTIKELVKTKIKTKVEESK